MKGMSKSQTHPYALEVSQRADGYFEWVIRDRGRLIERSDRQYPAEHLAREKGEAALERVFAAGNREDRRRQR